MLRLPGQQALKPLRDPLRRPFRNALHIRHVHDEKALFSGPPSYATIAQRFSSHPHPLTFFKEKKAKEAKERGEFIDIHDIGGVSPNDYDVFITDIDDRKLRSEVAEVIGIPYLKKTTKVEANSKVDVGHAFVYGHKRHTLFPCIVGSEDRAHWVFFMVHTGAPLTYLSVQATQVLGIESSPVVVTIAGYHHQVHVSPSNSHFPEVNILGSDFCIAQKVDLVPNRAKGTVNLYFDFGAKWEMPTSRS